MFKKITNQEFLTELEQRLPNFTQDDFATLLKVVGPYQEQVMKVIQATNLQIYQWIQEKHQQLEKEKIDKETEKLKKSLEKTS